MLPNFKEESRCESMKRTFFLPKYSGLALQLFGHRTFMTPERKGRRRERPRLVLLVENGLRRRSRAGKGNGIGRMGKKIAEQSRGDSK
jgi:hypothetical protein